MAHTPPRPVDIAGVFPELAGQGRATVRLHPRRGRPGPRDSSIGGPVLWPATEPWPRCDAGDRHVTKVYDPDAGWPGRQGRGGWRVATDPRHIAAPMVGVAQLFAGDVQGLPCAAGTDVCQVLWCPSWHEPDQRPRVRVCWRDSHAPELDGALAVAPPIDPDTAKESYIPKPCSLSPEQTIDYPDWADLPEELRPRIEAWEQDSDWIYNPHLSAAPGSKVGGWPVWTQSPEWPTCPRGHPMDHLLTIASWEYDGESWRTWRPPDLHYSHDDTGLVLGDAGNVYIFTCLTCDDCPTASVRQS